jgi:hypothetical protein
MASRHPRITVFAGAFASLVLMSVLSAALGRFVLSLIPKVCRRVVAVAERESERRHPLYQLKYWAMRDHPSPQHHHRIVHSN